MYDQLDSLAQMARERQAEMRRVADTERMLRDAGLPERKARPMQRKLVMAFAAASLLVFIFAQGVTAAH